MSQEQVGTRLPSDDARDLEQYCKEKDITKAEALRRSVRQLTENQTEQDRSVQFWRAAMVTGILLLGLTQSGILTGISAVFGAILVLVLLLVWVFTSTGLFRDYTG